MSLLGTRRRDEAVASVSQKFLRYYSDCCLVVYPSITLLSLVEQHVPIKIDVASFAFDNLYEALPRGPTCRLLNNMLLTTRVRRVLLDQVENIEICCQ